MNPHRTLVTVFTTLTVFALALWDATLVEAQPANVTGAVFETTSRPLAAGVEGTSRLGYRVPLVEGAGGVCCYDHDLTAGCRLGSTHGRGYHRYNEHEITPGRHLLVFLEPMGSAAEGSNDRHPVHAYDSACPIAADGLRIHWLGDVAVADSLEVLGRWAVDPHNDGSALNAIAHHAGPEATAFLARVARDPNLADSRRKSAAFWLGAERGVEGYRVLESLLETIDRPSFRAGLTTALAQSEVPAALERLIALARDDRSAKVRGEGLFWLAQTANARVPRVLMEAAERDPETSVKKRAVFAIAQLPAARGVPLLIDVAQRHASAAVRERAIFWLGQSDDPKALEFIVSLLER